MAYSEKVVDHYNNPRNVGSLDKNDPNVGTGMVGAPECGDVMKLQVKVNPSTGVIEEAKFKTFGCGSAIASSSLATEWLHGKTVDEALAIKNTDIVNELSLPPVKIHCSVLAEDAIKAAIGDYKKKAAAKYSYRCRRRFEGAQLNLKLFDLRREPVLREARSWFLWQFNPESLQDVIAAVSGERNASFAHGAGLLGYGGVHGYRAGQSTPKSFLAAHGEIVGDVFEDLSVHRGNAERFGMSRNFCKHMEAVAMSAPDAEETLARRRRAILAAAKTAVSASAS